jgi:hypothetical protein
MSGQSQHERPTDERLLLLKEYTDKFHHLAKEVRSLLESERIIRGTPTWTATRGALSGFLRELKLPAKDLASHVSQHIEHGEMDLFTRLEFKLRLAEFEQAIRSAEMLIDVLTG